MGLTLAKLEADLLTHLGVDLTDFTNGLTDVDTLLNRSYWKVCDVYKFKEKESSVTFPLVSGTSTYVIATLTSPVIYDSIQSVAIEDLVTFAHTPLDMMTIQEYESSYINVTTENAKPTRYIRDGQNANIKFWQTPDNIYNVTVYYWKTLNDLVSGGPLIPQSWHEVILFGAVYRGFYAFGDYNRAKKAKQVYLEMTEESTPVETKEKSNVPNAGLTVLGRDY